MAVTQERFNVVKLGAQGDEIKGVISINYLYWQSKTSLLGDDLLVKDSDENILWQDTADSLHYDNFLPLKNRVNGVKATVMDSGELYIYKEAEIPMQV